MADFGFYLDATVDEVTSILAAAGITTPHSVGARHLKANSSPPRYVWVPHRTAERKQPAARAVDEHRSILSNAEYFVVHCWGRNYAEAWALRQNVAKALHDCARADLRLESGQWTRPGESWNQHGEVYTMELSIVVPVFDTFVTIQESADEAPAYEPQSTAVIDDSGWTLFSSPDTDTDGEEAVDDNPPTP